MHTIDPELNSAKTLN